MFNSTFISRSRNLIDSEIQKRRDTKEKERGADLWSRLIPAWVRRSDIGLNVTRTLCTLHECGQLTLHSVIALDPGLFWLTGTNKSDVHPWGHCVIASDPSVSPPMGGLSETFYTNILWRISFTASRVQRFNEWNMVYNLYAIFSKETIEFSIFSITLKF